MWSGVSNECRCCRKGREPSAEWGWQPHSHSNSERWVLPHFDCPLTSSMILTNSFCLNWSNRDVRKKDLALLPFSVSRTSDTWLHPIVKLFIKMKSGEWKCLMKANHWKSRMKPGMFLKSPHVHHKVIKICYS